MTTSTSISNSAINQTPYLRTSRQFPEDAANLCQEVSKSYIDTALAVNARTIGLYPINRPAITGNNYYIFKSRVNQSLRQVYYFTSFTSPLSIPHGIEFPNIAAFSSISGTAFDGTNYYPLPYVDETLVTNQINVKINSTNIIITAGATAPTITSGMIILEWLVQG